MREPPMHHHPKATSHAALAACIIRERRPRGFGTARPAARSGKCSDSRELQKNPPNPNEPSSSHKPLEKPAKTPANPKIFQPPRSLQCLSLYPPFFLLCLSLYLFFLYLFCISCIYACIHACPCIHLVSMSLYPHPIRVTDQPTCVHIAVADDQVFVREQNALVVFNWQ